MIFTVHEERLYVADSDKLKEMFPEEYQEFLSRGGRDSDRDWVMDCIAEGGLQLLDFQDSEFFVD